MYKEVPPCSRLQTVSQDIRHLGDKVRVVASLFGDDDSHDGGGDQSDGVGDPLRLSAVGAQASDQGGQEVGRVVAEGGHQPCDCVHHRGWGGGETAGHHHTPQVGERVPET